jgi:hypothetical protein
VSYVCIFSNVCISFSSELTLGEMMKESFAAYKTKMTDDDWDETGNRGILPQPPPSYIL